MIEISNNFLLVWLVVLALICIYLLYMSLTRSNETDSLKSSISNLVRQNKKRDELINFLMERVETLTNAVNNLTLPQQLAATISTNPTNTNDNNIAESPENTENSELLAGNPEPIEDNNELNLDAVLNSISLPSQQHNPEPYQDQTHLTQTHITHAHLNQNNITTTAHEQSNVSSEFPEVISISEFGDKLTTQSPQHINLDDVLASIPTTFKDDDLISTILGADDSASQQGDEDHTKEPPGKIRLLGMNVKQLKQIAKDMNIKSRGNKTDLVESIWFKMNSGNGCEYIPPAQQQQTDLYNATQNENENDKMPELLTEEQTQEKTIENTHQETNNIPQLIVEDLPDDI